MYDWELAEFLRKRDGIISVNEYLHICNTCPQINHIKYDPFENMFNAWTDDGNYYAFRIYKE